MSGFTLAQVARATHGELRGEDRDFLRVCTDSRKLNRDELFFALQGPNFDGHAFIEQAAERGAAGAVVARGVQDLIPEVQVEDTRLALGRFAVAWRDRFDYPVVAVTGSNGKTTVKQLAAAILEQRGKVLATQGNLNNDIGVPLTLLEMRAEHTAAVIEMGANHPGEIRYLAQLARPTAGIVTNAGPAHLEGFRDLDGVAQAKGELFASILDGGTAVINADDAYASLWKELAGARRIVTFGLRPDADFTVASDSLESRETGYAFSLRTPDGILPVELPLPGRHNLVNALGAAAAAWTAGAKPEHIAAGLKTARNIGGRLQIVAGRNGIRVVDDTYNANPASLKAALQWVGELNAPVWLALGDMKELGVNAAELHAECGVFARARGIQRIFAAGELSARAVEAFGEGAEHYPDVEALIERLQTQLVPGVIVLVKGSRSMRMERVVAALTAQQRE